MKALIFDSGTLINLSMNGLLYILEEMKKNFSGKFLITKAVKYEVIDRPIGVQRFELGALLVQNLLDSRIIEMPESFGIDEKIIDEKTNELMETANHYLKIGENWIPLVSKAEMSCLALSTELMKKGIENIIAIDERTTRILCENPKDLEKLMSEKIHRRVFMIETNLSIFANYKFIRSSEMVFVAYKKGFIHISGKKALEALLYATKYKGAAISLQEIDILKKM